MTAILQINRFDFRRPRGSVSVFQLRKLHSPRSTARQTMGSLIFSAEKFKEIRNRQIHSHTEPEPWNFPNFPEHDGQLRKNEIIGKILSTKLL